MRLLLRSSRRHLLRHPWQMGLSALGVAMAVAVVVGIDLANASATKAFRLSVEGVAGRATHEVTAGPRGVDENLYFQLRQAGWRQAAPVVEGWVNTPELKRPLRLLGIDPFSEGEFRGFTRSLREREQSGELDRFLTARGTALLSEELAQELGLEVGDELEILASGRVERLSLIGLLTPDTELGRQTSRDFLVVDIAAAQEILDRLGRLSRIDLILPAEDVEKIQALLPDGTELAGKSARAGALDQMTRAFRLNLQALSLLALLVGMFLIYNTMTFSVVSRRPLIGTLRAMGVTRGEILRLILTEATWIALLGTAAGLLFGVALSRLLLQLVVQTINDLYFVLTVQGVGIPLMGCVKGLVLGLVGTLLAAFRPAREATEAPPRAVLLRSLVERQARRALPRLAIVGGFMIAGAAALLAIPSKDIFLSFAGLFLFVMGYACLVPGATFVAMRLLKGPTTKIFGILGTMASRGVAVTLSRTGVAMAALTIAVAMTVGVAIMVKSFRATLIDWLSVRLQADVFVAPVNLSQSGATIPADAVERIKNMPGVEHAMTSRHARVGSPFGEVRLQALELTQPAFDIFRFTTGDPDDHWRSFRQGAAMISEPFAFHHGLAPGDTLELLTDQGPQSFDVAGVFYDYSTDRGLIILDQEIYHRYWNDRGVTTMGIYAAPGIPPADLLTTAQDAAGNASERLRISANRDLREGAIEIFDRTFVITGVLRLLTIAVAFIGVLSALMALQLERARELGILRANGLTPSQVRGLVTTQTGLMGLVAGLLAAPLGVLLATLLIHVINKRSFGWTLFMDVSPGILLQAILLALAAALLAGLYPALKMSRSSPAWALREE